MSDKLKESYRSDHLTQRELCKLCQRLLQLVEEDPRLAVRATNPWGLKVHLPGTRAFLHLSRASRTGRIDVAISRGGPPLLREWSDGSHDDLAILYRRMNEIVTEREKQANKVERIKGVEIVTEFLKEVE